jgi:hypothetical protein
MFYLILRVLAEEWASSRISRDEYEKAVIKLEEAHPRRKL